MYSAWSSDKVLRFLEHVNEVSGIHGVLWYSSNPCWGAIFLFVSGQTFSSLGGPLLRLMFENVLCRPSQGQ